MKQSRESGVRHLSNRSQWLRAAVLGSEDALVSISSLMIGIAAAQAPPRAVLVAGIAGLVAGAMSMAAGEYVSVSSQRDSEEADIERERHELHTEPEAELAELAAIYTRRGLDHKLAVEVAHQLTAHDNLGSHMRDELGIETHALAQPWLAAWVSGVSFAVSALIPLVVLMITPVAVRIPVVAVVSLASLTLLGAFGGHLGGAPRGRAALRVALGGGLAMAVTAGIGHLLGAPVA